MNRCLRNFLVLAAYEARSVCLTPLSQRGQGYGWSGFGLLDFLGGLLFVILKDKIDLVVVIQLKNGGEFASFFGYEIIEWTNPSFFNQFVDFFDRQSSAGYALGMRKSPSSF